MQSALLPSPKERQRLPLVAAAAWRTKARPLLSLSSKTTNLPLSWTVASCTEQSYVTTKNPPFFEQMRQLHKGNPHRLRLSSSVIVSSSSTSVIKHRKPQNLFPSIPTLPSTINHVYQQVLEGLALRYAMQRHVNGVASTEEMPFD